MTYIRPFLKHTGGKYLELNHIIPNFPKVINDYYEPFVGGGSVYLNVPDVNGTYNINDLDKHLSSFWKGITREHVMDMFMKEKSLQVYIKNITDRMGEGCYRGVCGIFLSMVSEVEYACNFVDKKISQLSDDETVTQSEFKRLLVEYQYYRSRDIYNGENWRDELSTIFYVKEYAFQGMDRYNSKGKFNVPFGGNSYVDKDITPKLKRMDEWINSPKYNRTTTTCLDFREFLMQTTTGHPDDFIFLDPPYTTKFSTYGNNIFSKEDHKDLAYYLKNVVKCNWMMVINKDDFTEKLYNDFNIFEYDKKYKGNFKNRTKTGATHMLITNYEV